MQTPSNKDAFLEHLVHAVVGRFAKPTDELPSVQCASKAALFHALLGARKELRSLSHERLSREHLLEQIVRTGLIRPLPIQPLLPGLRYELFAVGLIDDPDVISPAEILMAMAPKGVICYFSAIQIHGLSTQIPPFHHIAELVHKTPSEGPVSSGQAETGRPLRPRDPLGTKVFNYRDQDYYITRRVNSRVLASQQLIQSDRALVRITSLEQTLVDCLTRPKPCGGPPTVFEAWNEGSRLLDQESLAGLLVRLRDATLNRRVGYMIENCGNPITALRLKNLLDESRLQPLKSPSPQSLLPGIDYEKVSSRWQLRVP